MRLNPRSLPAELVACTSLTVRLPPTQAPGPIFPLQAPAPVPGAIPQGPDSREVGLSIIMQIPAVDYFTDDAPTQFTNSLRQTGFGILANHPIRPGLVEEIYAEWREFFSTATKHAYRPADGAQNGYFPSPEAGAATSDGVALDRKEFFQIYPDRPYPSEVSDAALLYL